MMGDTIKISGKIVFDPKDKTTKHKNQAIWKRVAMVVFDNDDICEYYSWFVNKRYNVLLNKPLRSSHITFINDSTRDLNQNGELSEEEVNNRWLEVKNKWDGKIVDIILDVDIRTNGEHWWLNIPHENRIELQSIRTELGLGRPYFGMHMSIGYARPGIHEEHSKYIHDLIKLGFAQ